MINQYRQQIVTNREKYPSFNNLPSNSKQSQSFNDLPVVKSQSSLGRDSLANLN